MHVSVDGREVDVVFDEGWSIGDVISTLYSLSLVSHSLEKVILVKKKKNEYATVKRNIVNYLGDPVKLLSIFDKDRSCLEESNIYYSEDDDFTIKVVFVDKESADLNKFNIKKVPKEKILTDILEKYNQILNK